MDKKNLTSFQWQVLGVTATIPYGETRTYQWIARRIGRPKAARAVGQALKINPYAPVIPCHRVIKTDGSLSGYQGKSGLAKKDFLLKIEKEIMEGRCASKNF
ncbi:MAG TPA: MGMT family protein [Candidatus Omnitrophota bacterium]|nr:MGMT family protein [Candidatus Omnitrophota bacterium]